MLLLKRPFLPARVAPLCAQRKVSRLITYYTKSHEYIKINDEDLTELKKKNNVKCKIGISNYGTEKLGEIVYIDISQNINEYVKKGECIATVESVKSVGDVYTPISGQIVDINNEIVDNVNLMNGNSESDGWILELLTNDVNEKEIMSFSEYKKMCEEEEQREATKIQQSERDCLEEKNKNKIFDLNDIKNIEEKTKK
ncbi:glycine cleavage system H protein, putative [Plasmodium knowlesi strain H]|uniref:Glycine cleavage system H protein, putative n=3 Tax=Plasmodium knowlesi TaxID=5850 RepID=A0A5K1VJ13_PLAKH|nr:glycine cleavage system H protein, putative [Plasmodium knowlesi strain H]OTN64933.1 putative Glycine cleavage system H protein [Plasmodium knowlesi]CAA9988355.1 glycine cleavage system H protein, putative [Plasmodium knowlesi strain H]SBO20061.1 glycine cleavage system H protein, putative [Plasmodium knowlesi strain H]SBO20312.1 glycine cleavage system H protein, putative [Plasmodium knowlesi strain H]VVS77829.1 glycine cleavage system H protein, putative [Plasmodium knowlesi strain H]|eukprot:XP_002259335.1 glycine cleavage system H protein, putative [Plasmodium knowlesi strain H]